MCTLAIHAGLIAALWHSTPRSWSNGLAPSKPLVLMLYSQPADREGTGSRRRAQNIDSDVVLSSGPVLGADLSTVIFDVPFKIAIAPVQAAVTPAALGPGAGGFRSRLGPYRAPYQSLYQQQAQQTQQRTARADLVRRTLDDLTERLRQSLPASLNCRQTAPQRLSCTPEAGRAAQDLLAQILAQLIEARRLGIGSTLVRMQLGQDRILSLNLLPP